ncbi:LutC/YkgG family protein [Desulfatirhabdium butyrativorans]|uniref:LutC/YkgG family protein n=1 Tax=Desulfatirhabdium butyrativorans TaxID=340467 RepID=UPI0003F8F127|nr:lactate utilization protein [Desulfatirhabdium butyrativorans]
MGPDSAEHRFFVTLRTALERRGPSPDFESLFPGKTGGSSSILGPDAMTKHRERQQWIQAFIEEAKALFMDATRIETPEQLADAIGAIAEATHAEWAPVRTAVCCNHPMIAHAAIADNLRDRHIDVHFPDAAASPEAFRNRCAEATLGIFVADYAIAESATLVLRNCADCPRLVSLLPSASIAIVPMECILPTFSQLADILACSPANEGMSFITGPSKTADIEAVMVQGAHGPRSLHVLFTSF